MDSIIVLTANWEYWDEVGLEKFLTWYHKGDKIEVVLDREDKKVGSVSLKIPMPLVVKLKKWFGMKPKSDYIRYSAPKVYARDHNICQYWHINKKGQKIKFRCKESERTIDHIHPESKGGKDTFENCVCSCIWHNEQKGNKLLHETKFELIKKPVAPQIKTKGEFLKVKFVYNPNKISHKYYVEKILMQKKKNGAEDAGKV
jgi:hypothetical protein